MQRSMRCATKSNQQGKPCDLITKCDPLHPTWMLRFEDLHYLLVGKSWDPRYNKKVIAGIAGSAFPQHLKFTSWVCLKIGDTHK